MIRVKPQEIDSSTRLENSGLEAAKKTENAQENSQWGKSSFTIIESTKTPEESATCSAAAAAEHAVHVHVECDKDAGPCPSLT